MSAGDDLEHVYEFLTRRIDPLVQRILNATNPWDAHDPVGELASAILNEDFPDSGAIYVAWEELADVYEIGKSPVEDAHAALRQAAQHWLLRPQAVDSAFLAQWTERAQSLSDALFKRDGNIVWKSTPD